MTKAERQELAYHARRGTTGEMLPTDRPVVAARLADRGLLERAIQREKVRGERPITFSIYRISPAGQEVAKLGLKP